MASQPVQNTRIQRLNDRELKKGNYVLYWMHPSEQSTIMPLNMPFSKPMRSARVCWWVSV
jgi:hypothetical protein